MGRLSTESEPPSNLRSSRPIKAYTRSLCLVEPERVWTRFSLDAYCGKQCESQVTQLCSSWIWRSRTGAGTCRLA
jgi:hypothetical protein